jgi:saccharopine dehydrogenase-like NADP-dependent oxidoreductase
VRVIVLGTGAVGARAARQLASSAEVDRLHLCDRTPARAEAVASSLGLSAEAVEWSPSLLDDAGALVVAAPGQQAAVQSAIESDVAVVSVVDAMAEVEELMALDTTARAAGVPVVVGAGMAPGLTCVLAAYAAATFTQVEEIHVAKSGTGGPDCARQHHGALGDEAMDWRDNQWVRRRGGSGRELCWFPDPVGGQDCYRAGLPDALLLVPAFHGVRRVTARMAASRRDRLTSALPMLRPPHPEGEVGAVRVEVRGESGTHRDVQVLGVIDRPAVAAGAVAAVAAVWAATGRMARSGSGGLAEMVSDPAGFLAELNRRGVKAAVFEGARP